MKIMLRMVVALLAALMLVLSSCSSLHTVTEENDRYRDKKTGIVYLPLSAAYEPISRGAEYAKLNMSGIPSTLHEIVGLEPTQWLCSVYGDVYYAQNTALKEFADWTVSAAYVCTNTEVSVARLTLRRTYTDQAAVIDTLQHSLCNGTSVYYPSYATLSDTYILRFESEDVPGIYYSVKLLRYAEDIYEGVQDANGNVTDVNVGRTFLYDRYANRCIAIDSTLFELLDGTDTGGGAS